MKRLFITVAPYFTSGLKFIVIATIALLMPMVFQKRFFYIYILFCSICFLLLLNSCDSPAPIKKPTSFKEDSLQVRHLMKVGDSVYAKRSSIGTIAQSLPYFDSANRLAQRLNDTILLASTTLFIGNVYNAWNGEPKTTIKFYNQSAELFKQLPTKQLQYFYTRYLIAHAWDAEKANDSGQCIKVLKDALKDLKVLPDSTLNSFIYLSDYAWVATNVKAYDLADSFLKLAPRSRIFNDPESNNYLDHFYLAKARMDIFGEGIMTSQYLDSLQLALSNCKNRYDSGYYTFNLSILFEKVGNAGLSLRYSRLTENLRAKLGESNVLSVLRQELLLRDLNYEKEQQRNIAASLRANKILFGGIVLVALLLVLLYYLYQKRKRDIARRKRQETFTRLLLQKEEDERRRLASDLHDGINHDLLSLRNNLIQGQAVSLTQVDDVMTTIREVSRNLYPVMFETVGLQASVQALCEKAAVAGFFTSCDLNYKPILTKYEELQLYRITQEALNNVCKHARAEAARIAIQSGVQAITLEIKDNGKGFDVAKALESSTSFGLQSMKQRAEAIGATINIKSLHTGTTIFVTKKI